MASIDEGAPIFTSRSGGTGDITGANLSTAMRMHTWDSDVGGNAEVDFPELFVGATGIHDQTFVRVGGGDASYYGNPNLRRNMHMVNPIGYKDRGAMVILEDLIITQAHAGHLFLRMLPVADKGVNQFGGAAAGAHWSVVNRYVDFTGTPFTFLTTIVAAREEQFTFNPLLPSNVAHVVEAVAGIVASMSKGPAGSDNGMAFQLALFTSLGQRARTMYCDFYTDGSAQYRTAKFEQLAMNPGAGAGAWGDLYISIKSARGSAGASPNPFWKLTALELGIHCEVNDIVLVDDAQFNGFQANDPFTLDCDLVEYDSFYDAIMDVLNHAPPNFLYIDYRSCLVPNIVPDHATATPIDITDWIIGFDKSRYKYKERSARAVELWWGVQVPQKFTAQSDPVNVATDRPERKLRRGAKVSSEIGYDDAKIIKRHFIRTAAVAEVSVEAYLQLWQKEPDAVEPLCDWRALKIEPGDVCIINRPELGFNNRKFTCVANPVENDDDRVRLILYDIKYIP